MATTHEKGHQSIKLREEKVIGLVPRILACPPPLRRQELMLIGSLPVYPVKSSMSFWLLTDEDPVIMLSMALPYLLRHLQKAAASTTAKSKTANTAPHIASELYHLGLAVSPWKALTSTDSSGDLKSMSSGISPDIKLRSSWLSVETFWARPVSRSIISDLRFSTPGMRETSSTCM